MMLFGDLPDIARVDEPMASHTSFRVGGRVRYFLEPRDWDELRLSYQRCREAGLRIRVLGRGSNTLVGDGHYYWPVISTRRLRGLHRDGNRLEVGAGIDLTRLLSAAESWGLGGLEPLSGIPGTVGGAVAMNAGGRYGCVADRLAGALVAMPGEMPCWMDASELGLAYRRSNLVDGRPFLLSATFDLESARPERLLQRRRSILAEKSATQPLRAWSAGCVFKNPRGSSAGFLIDKAGLKGLRVGGAVVSTKHANFIVNSGGATATDVLQLIGLVVERVYDAFGVRLELEIEVWADNLEREHYGRA
jgi:UDP-N-acetylmuramate dehydrogenase